MIMMMISLISWKQALLHTGLFVCLLSVIRLSVRHIAVTNHNVCVNNKLVTQFEAHSMVKERRQSLPTRIQEIPNEIQPAVDVILTDASQL
jgi:hypothetical protein